MKPPRNHPQEPLVEADPAQLWARQRPLRTKSRSDSDDNSTCTCRNAQADASPSTFDAIDSSQILAGRREVRIVHAGEVYRLLVTRNNKLILQK